MKGYYLTSFLLFFVALAAVGIRAQSASNDTSRKPNVTKEAIPVDDFGSIGDCDFGARLDNFYIQLNNNLDAVGYVIMYPGIDMLPSEGEVPPHMRQMRKYVAFRRYDASRLVFVNGGYRVSGATEFFLVPTGAVPPKPTNTVATPKAPKGTFLWSRSSLSNEEVGLSYEFVLESVKAKEAEEERLQEIENAKMREDEGNVEAVTDIPVEIVEDEKVDPEQEAAFRYGWFDARFLDQLTQRKDSSGVIIFYADDERYDIAKVRRFVFETRDRFAKQANIRPDLITIKFGGYRSVEEAEYWIMPKGGKTPKPTPEERPVEVEEPNY